MIVGTTLILIISNWKQAALYNELNIYLQQFGIISQKVQCCYPKHTEEHYH